MINIPEIAILTGLRNTLKLLRTDYNNCVTAGDETKSILYLITGTNQMQRYKFFEQAKALFITTENDPRHLDVNIFFNAKRMGLPTYHITLPSEFEKNNAIGISEGQYEPEYDDDGVHYRRTLNRRFGAKYVIVCTSDNLNEVVLMYHFFKSIMISLTDHFNLCGLFNIKLSGNDISLNSEIVPEAIFSRGTGMDFEYDVEAYDLFLSELGPYAISGVDSMPLDLDQSVSF